ncbi:hypothetical protein IT882_10695 [Microbacterium schleiferi]|uniref:Uncharacterized protein n=1 Tax=Microbacterium schleiferi TaxID=69362 RepID=A0A7S8RGV2_9MICO|nr:DUF6264 family protein [Microbacterium schleiferi]QPE03752.1 hypothetical protein IT882_10695 [Microbacterium schleiferi]
MSDDERPEPKYGVYATPEEQRARIQKPDATWSLETGESVTDDAEKTSANNTARAAGAPADPARSRAVDRIVTFALLAYALVNVAVAAIALLDFPQYAATVFEVMGIPGEFTNLEGGQAWGAAAAVALVIGYLIAAWFSVRRTMAGKLAWWVPLVGAVVTHLVVGALAIVPLMSDPAFTAYLTSIS